MVKTESTIGNFTVSRGIVHVGVVDYCRRSRIQRLETPSQLAPEDVFGGIVERLHIASRHIVQQGVIRMSSLEQRLPYMVVRIDESGRYNLAGAVDHLRLIRWDIYMIRDASNLVPLDEQRVASKRYDRFTTRRTRHQDGGIAQEDRLS